MTRRTPHGEVRHADAGRPTSEAFTDKPAPREVYKDNESGYYIFVGSRGRTHVFTADGFHHTSFRTTRANREKRCIERKWERISHGDLPEELK